MFARINDQWYALSYTHLEPMGGLAPYYISGATPIEFSEIPQYMRDRWTRDGFTVPGSADQFPATDDISAGWREWSRFVHPHELQTRQRILDLAAGIDSPETMPWECLPAPAA